MNRLTIAIGVVVYASFNALGQGVGTFEFMNVGVANNRQIYVDTFQGPVKAAGTGYSIAVYWGPSGTTDENALVQVGASTPFLDSPAEGQFSGGGRTIFGVAEGGAVVALQARAWDMSTGATWEAAAANPAGRVGKGPVFEMALKDPVNFPLDPSPRLGYAAGWVGFAITPVPEPSTWALAGLGVIGLLIFSQRRR